MKRLLAVLVVASALGLAPTTSAKGLVAVEVCGLSGCNRAEDEQTLRNVPGGSETEVPLGPAVPFFRVTFVMGEGTNTHRSTLYYMPSQRAMAYVDPYESVRAMPIFGPTANGTIRRLAAGLRPFPAPRVTSVAVGGKVLAGPDAHGYLELFRVGTEVPRTYPDEWVPVDLRSPEPSPWTAGARELMFSPDGGLIERGGALFGVPAWVADDIEAGRALEEPAGSGWRMPALGAASVLLVLALVGAAARRGGRGRRPALPGVAQRL